MKKLYRLTPLFMIAMVILLQACSAKKNTAGSRFWQALNTRYNVYYHGKTNYDEQIKIVEDEYQDDYSQRLFIHPAEAKSAPKAPQPGGSFDRTIEKMQKAIALHSIKKKPKKQAGKGSDPKYKEWMKREEYNPFLHNAWYMLAKSEYMKGDFLNAAATFRYISRHFPWKTDLAQEAQVWEALCYCAMGWTNEADNVLAHIHIDKIDNGRIRSLANLAFADYHIKDKRNEKAIPYLAEAVKGAKGSQKVRLNFLLGQLYEEIGDKAMAYRAFKKAGSSNSSSYRTKFNARIKQSAVFSGYNVTGEVKALRNMARYDRNKEYLDQIYYAIGNLYLTRGDTVHAIENYKKAAEKSTRNGVDKAISQLTLGGIYFNQHKYDLAQPCYAEAIPQISEDYPNYKMLKHRSDVLDELSVYSQNVTLQDSLLELSKLPLEEQKKVIKKIIDELKKKEKEEAENAAREEYMSKQNANGNPLGNKGNQPTTFQMNNDNSWYFYNTATKNAGKTQFQQTWGNRKLEDNWRRRNKATFSLGDNTESDTTAVSSDSTMMASNDSTKVDKEAMKRAEDPHYEEYYLKQIPKTEEQIQAAHDIIMEGLFNMGVILKDKLEDMDAAEYQFNELMRRYPDNTYRMDAYYNMYLMYMRYGQTGKAEACRDIILSDFADSKYGQAMQDPDYLENLKNMERDQEAMYEQAYSSYLSNNNEAVHAAYAEMMRKYPLSKIMPKFMFIDALSYVTQKNYEQFKTTIKDMLQRYPETDITPVASGIVKQLNSGRKLTGGSSNTRGMIWSTRLANDSTSGGIEREFTPFKDEPDKPHSFIVLYPTDSVSSNLLLYEVARHNFNAFVVKDYDLEQMTFSRLGLLVVKGFANYDEAVHYRTVFEEDKDMAIPENLTKVIISDGNFQLLLNEGRSFEDYFEYLEHRNDEVVENKVPELKAIKKANEESEDLEESQAATTLPDASGMTKHVVKKGDKLSKLANQYKVPAADIRKANGLSDDKIKIGDTLLIPVNPEKVAEQKAIADEAKKQKADEAKKAQADKKNAETKKQEAARKKAAEDESNMEERRRKEAEERIRREEAEVKNLESSGSVSINDDINGESRAENDANKDEGVKGIGNKTSRTQSRDQLMRANKEKREKAIAERKAREEEERKAREEKANNDNEKAKADLERAQSEQKADAAGNTGNDEKTAPATTDKPRSVKDTKDEEKKAKEEAKKAEKKAKEDAKKAEKERKKAEEERKKQREAEMKQRDAEAKKQQEAEMKQRIEAEKLADAKLKAEIKQKEREAKAKEKAEMEVLKEKEKAEKERMKKFGKVEKQKQDSIKRAEKEADKLLAKLQKAREDSIARVDKAREDSLDALDQARIDTRKQMEKDRAQIERDKIQAKIDAKKQQEKERKERMKAKEEERKAKAKERKEKQKEREKARKEREKERKAEAKEREKAQKQKQKEREDAQKQKQKEREEAQKQKERERKDKAAAAKASKK